MTLISTILAFVTYGRYFRPNSISFGSNSNYIHICVSLLIRKLPNNTEEAGEPFGDEARIYTRDLIMHRELKFEVDSMDRVGNLIGWFTLPSEVKVIAPKSVTSSTEAKKKGGKKSGASYSSANLSVVLVARGYATVNRSPASQRANHYNTLLKAEQFAQEQRLGMWSSEEFRNNWDAARSVDHGDRGSEDQVANESSGDVGTAPKGIISMRELQKALPVDLEATKKDAAARLVSLLRFRLCIMSFLADC